MKTLLASILMFSSFSALAVEWTQGEVRRVDAENKKLTIKHQEIKTLDMPEMTMVFYVDHSSTLQGLNAGDSVEFTAVLKNTKYYVTAIKKR